MIFVTVGTQLAFDRMVSAVDQWAAAHPDVQLFAQIGPGQYCPRHMEHADFLSPSRARELTEQAEVIVAHAGMGSVLAALGLSKPIVIVPRRAGLGEHRNDHQLATARWLAERPGVYVAWHEDEIAAQLDARHRLVGGAPITGAADGPLVERLRDAVDAAFRG